ncbi:GDSL-type esterase/lipase family protein [Methylobacter sp. S3L5C]|uniref:SGNH/GDSL hydrolase family protein n=1 Tax=Methylobacter sp. S3L5C TaxID=2839024 RepID=UPI001FABC50F|nr:GDSL-type esterase/lipase family protein [Methylobacter sp. S3L5C]UOA08325.1 hypothetical protein KKZ03_19315 [Methylobacter sp. S3L5C]
MTTTVRLLQKYTLSGVPYAAGDLVAINDTTAAQLVTGKIADSDSNAVNRALSEGEMLKFPETDALTYFLAEPVPETITPRTSIAELTNIGAERVGKRMFLEGSEVGGNSNIAKNILLLGTSITNMTSASLRTTDSTPQPNTELYNSNGWAFWMSAALKFPFGKLINKGVGGNKVWQMRARYASDVAANFDNFDLLIFEPGPNDYSDDSYLIEQMILDYIYIIETTLSAGKTVVVLSPSPSNSPNSTTNPTALGVIKRQQLLSWLAGYIALLDNAIYVNTDSILADPSTGLFQSEFTTDGVHPNTSGAKVMGIQVARSIKNLVSPTYIHLNQRSDRQYLPNPRLSGNNASGANNFYAGSGITVAGGPDSVSIATTKGTWVGGTNTVTIAPYIASGEEDHTFGGTLITIVNAPSDQASITLDFGCSANTLAGTQYGYINGAKGWSQSTAMKLGDNVRATGFTTGFWQCIKSGVTTTGTVPLPTSESNYGQSVLDGTVLWVWKKLPAAGDIFQADLSYEIKSLSGSIEVAAGAYLVGVSNTVAEAYGVALFPKYDNTMGNPGSGYPGKYIPRAGVLRSPEITLIQPTGNPIRFAYVSVQIILMAGSSATIYIPEVNLIRL